MGDIVKRHGGYTLRWYEGGKRRTLASHQTSYADARRMLLEIEARVARGGAGVAERRASPPTVAELVERSRGHRGALSSQRINRRGEAPNQPPPRTPLPRGLVPFRHRGEYVGWFTSMRTGSEALGTSLRDAHVRGELWTVARDNLVILEARYQNGDALVIEFLNAQVDLTDAEIQLANVTAQLRQAWLELDAALGRILMQINGGDAGPLITCEDGCYGTACPSGQICQQNACKQNPCAGKTCPEEQTCQPDGTCAAVCVVSCPLGSVCQRGRCIPDACSGSCGAGQLCDSSTSQCKPDPKCQGIVCHTSQGCFGGVCVDNPCVYLTCPSGYTCRDFNGSCQLPAGTEPPKSGGCDFTRAPHQASGAAAFGTTALLLAALWLRRRRGALS